MTTDIASLSMEFSANGAKESVRDMRNVEAQAGKTEAATKKMETATGQMGVSFKANGNILQQAGYQVGDFAVQVASGQSALVAFTQQGAQLAGAFGPGGAVLGAVIAIGGAIGGVLFKSLMSGKKATDLLTESMKRLESVVSESNGVTGLTKELQELARTSEVIAKGRIVSAMAATEDASKHAAKSIIDEFNKVIDLFGLMKFSTVLKADAFTYKTSNVFQTIQDDLKLTGEAGEKAANDIFFALRDINTKPTAENFKKLEEILTSASTTFAKDSKKLQKLIYDISKPFDEVRKASEIVEKLKKTLAEGVSTSAPVSELDKLIAKLQIQADTVGMNTLQMIEYNRQIDLKAAREKTATIEQIKGINVAYDSLYAHERSVIALDKERTATQKAEQELKAYERRLRSVSDRLDDAGAAQRRYAEDLQLLRKALANSASDEEAANINGLIKKLEVEYSEAGKKASNEFMKPFELAANNLSSSLQNAIASGDWKNIGDAVGNTMATSMSAVISKAITDELSKGITEDSSALSKISAAFSGPMVGAITGGLIQVAMSELADYFSDDYDPTASRQASIGTGTVLGSIDEKSLSIQRAVEGSESGIGQLVGINQAMLRTLQQTQAGIQNAATRVARGASNVTLPAFDPGTFSSDAFEMQGDFFSAIFTGGLLDIGGLLGSSSKHVDEGVRIVGGELTALMDNIVVQAYNEYRARKHAGDDYDTYRNYANLGDDVGQQFSLVFESLYDSILSGAEILGVNASSALDNFVIDTQKISLEKMNAEEQRQAFATYFSSVFDEMTIAALPYLEEFQEAGEGLGETLSRMANNVLLTEEAVHRLGINFSDLAGRDLLVATDRLIELAGGAESFVNAMGMFVDNFYSEVEQFNLAQSDITRALDQVNLTLPTTREEYQRLLEAQDGATESGANNIATLLRLQGIADDYYTYLEDSATDALKAQEAAREKAEQARKESLDRQLMAYSAVRGAINGLYGDSLAFQQMQRAQAEMLLGDMVRSGVITYGETFNDALRTVTNINVDEFSTMNDFIREQSSVGSLLSDLESIAIKGSTIEEDTLAAITSGNSGIIKGLSQINQTLGGHSSAIPSPIIPRSPSTSTANKNKSENDPDELLILTRSIVQNTAKSTKLLSKFDKDGIPTI